MVYIYNVGIAQAIKPEVFHLNNAEDIQRINVKSNETELT